MQRKTKLAVAVGAALFAVGGAVQAQTVAPSQAVTIQLYGQVNRALMHADNDTQSKVFFVDGQSSSTRFGITGTGQIAPGLRLGGRIETEIRSNQSNAVTFAVPATAGQTFTERWLDVFLQGGWGQINLGQGSGAADGAAEVNLHGAGLALSNPMNDFGGAIPFTTGAGATFASPAARLSAAPTTIAATSPDSVSVNHDFESRNDRLMYTTPTFAGFRAQVGVGQVAPGSTAAGGESKEASLWYAGKFAGDFQAALGWSSVNVGPDARETIGGSAAWLHASGFNVAGTYMSQELGVVDRDSTYWSAAVGYKFGRHAIALKYEMTEDFALAGDEATGIGLGYVWNPVNWADVYAGYMMYQLDRTGLDVNDITVGVVGMRFRF